MKVLFICRGNRFRSPIAEAMFNKAYPQHKAESAGTAESRAGQPLPKETVEALMKEGADVSRQKTRLVTKKMVEKADRVVVLCAREYCPDFILSSRKTEFWDITDPESEGMPSLESVKKALRKKISEMKV